MLNVTQNIFRISPNKYYYDNHPEKIRVNSQVEYNFHHNVHDCYELPNKIINKHPVIFSIHNRQSS